jgi:type IV secretory pathway VirJ component
MQRLVLILSIFLIAECSIYGSSISDTVVTGTFGTVHIYKPLNTASSFVIMLSGEAGWNKNSETEAKYITSLGAMVIGIDLNQYILRLKKGKSKCYYPASDLETLSLSVQKKYKFHQYFKPVLIGYSEGATLVYGALVQAPSNTFKGAIAMGFCPVIDIDKPLCKGNGLKFNSIQEGVSYYLEPANNLTAPFYVLHGLKDTHCSNDISQFMKLINMGQIIDLPNVGRGFTDTSEWHSQFRNVYKKVLAAPTYAEQKAAENSLLKSQPLEKIPSDMPITLIPSAIKDTLPLVFLLSGDGGWTSFDHAIGEAFALRGMPVVGLDDQKYFWNEKTPQEAATDFEKVILHYMKEWNRNSFILVGYSFGACVVPFVADRFTEPTKAMLCGVYALSPDETADFEIHITDMLSLGNSNDTYNVLEEVRKIKHLHPVCIFGSGEDENTRNRFVEEGSKVYTLPGSHHYDYNSTLIAETVYNDLKKQEKK